MVFTSVSFLIFFLPCVLAAYFLVPKRHRDARNCVLLGFSLLFYACGGVRYLGLILLSIAVNFACGLLAEGGSRRRRRAALAGAVVFGAALLGWFKYAGFFARTVNGLGLPVPVPEVALPVGISFFTFQGLSYVIDVYRGSVRAQRNPLYVGLYIALFPQLVAGPIVRYGTIEREIVCRDESLAEFSEGLTRFLFGLGKKLLLANAIGQVSDRIFAIPAGRLSTATAWIGAAAYTFQIYFDFSSYSDMAIGLGRMFGFRFLENFNYPYIAQSVTDFWRRWHISLTTWFKDYLYIPLGGSRCARWKHIRNLAAVWLLTGLWHGASWNFVLWGVWFLALLIGEKFLWGKVLERAPKILRHVYTMLLVIVSWVLFRAPTLGGAAAFLGAMFGQAQGGLVYPDAVYYLKQYGGEFLLCLVGIFPVKNVLQAWLRKREDNPAWALVLAAGPKLIALALLALSFCKLVAGGFQPFIYFQF